MYCSKFTDSHEQFQSGAVTNKAGVMAQEGAGASRLVLGHSPTGVELPPGLPPGFLLSRPLPARPQSRMRSGRSLLPRSLRCRGLFPLRVSRALRLRVVPLEKVSVNAAELINFLSLLFPAETVRISPVTRFCPECASLSSPTVTLPGQCRGSQVDSVLMERTHVRRLSATPCLLSRPGAEVNLAPSLGERVQPTVTPLLFPFPAVPLSYNSACVFTRWA